MEIHNGQEGLGGEKKSNLKMKLSDKCKIVKKKVQYLPLGCSEESQGNFK